MTKTLRKSDYGPRKNWSRVSTQASLGLEDNQALLFVDPRKPDEFIVVGLGTPIQEVKTPGL